MPVFHKLVDYTEMFDRLQEPPIVINDLPNITEEDRAAIDELIMTRYSSDMLSVLPSCRCGKTKGEYAIGVNCEYCNTPVKSKVEQDIEPLVWFRRPLGVAQLINPSVYIMLRNRFKVSGFEVIDWLLDTTHYSVRKVPEVCNIITSLGIQRGYNYFVENFDQIIDTLFSLKQYKLRGNKKDELHELVQRDRQIIFSDYIPLPNKSLFIVENTSTGKYVDETISGAKDAINMLISIDRRFAASPVRIRENRTAKALSRLTKFYEKFTAENISPKSGLIRRHIIGSRSHFCFRAVITSITRPHKYNHVEIPWSIGVTVFRDHLLSKLMRIGFSHNAGVSLMVDHVNRYHPLLDKLLKELIDEAPNGSIAVTAQRNPSLHQGSMQLMYIERVKTDPNDLSIGLPILSVRPFNADFDGVYKRLR